MGNKMIRNFIDGEFVSAGNTFEKRSPVNNEVIATVAEASREERSEERRVGKECRL